MQILHAVTHPAMMIEGHSAHLLKEHVAHSAIQLLYCNLLHTSCRCCG